MAIDGRMMARRAMGALAGPVVIALCVVLAMDEVLFHDVVSGQNRDILSFWLPTHCYLGRSIADGVAPGWNPYIIGGMPLAGEPQSGWMYFPAMLLYSQLSCDVALRYFIALQPLLGGVGAYAFLRAEQVSRPAATIGGATVALGIAQPRLAYTLPFSGAVAWTAVALAFLALALNSRSWGARIAWAGLAALAWGQIAAAHLSHGFVAGTALIGLYAIAKLVRRRGLAQKLGVLGIFALGCIVLNLAYFLPRFSYLPRSSMGFSETSARDILEQVAGISTGAGGDGVGPTGDLNSYLSRAVAPAQFALAVAYVFCFAGLAWRRGRAVVVAVLAFGTLLVVLTNEQVASALRPLIGDVGLARFYFHNPARLRHPFALAAGLLVGFGIHAWFRADTERSPRAAWILRLAMLAPGVTLWIVLTYARGRATGSLLLAETAVVLGAVGAAAWLATRRLRGLLLRDAAAVAASTVVVGVLAANAVIPGDTRETWPGGEMNLQIRGGVETEAFVQHSPLEQAVATAIGSSVVSDREVPAGRVLNLDVAPGTSSKAQLTSMRRLQANRRGMLFGQEEAQGFNSVQPLRYWLFVQAVTGGVRYNSSIFLEPYPLGLDLLAVTHITMSPPLPGRPPGRLVAEMADGRVLYELDDPTPRATLHADWDVVDGMSGSLNALLEGGFDSRRDLVVEGRLPIEPTEGEAPEESARFRWTSTQSAVVDVATDRDAIVVIRNTYDPGWRATVDGRPVDVVPVDLFLQGVPIGAGDRRVELTYEHPGLAPGLWLSAIAALAFAGAAGATVVIGRRRRRSGAPLADDGEDRETEREIDPVHDPALEPGDGEE